MKLGEAVSFIATLRQWTQVLRQWHFWSVVAIVLGTYKPPFLGEHRSLSQRHSAASRGAAWLTNSLGRPVLHQQFADHPPIQIRESLITTAVAEGEAFVVDAHLVEEGGVDADGVACHRVAEVVRLAKRACRL